MCHHLNYITILGHEYEIQHNPIPHMGTATIHLPQVIKEMKPLNDLCWHMYTYKYISIKSLRLFHNYVKHVALHSPDKDTNTKLYLH